MAVAVVIVAGGSGYRAGGELPKQYQLIGGKAMIWWTLKAFLDHPAVKLIQTVINPEHRNLYHKAIAELPVAEPVFGGATRQDSCRLGIEACLGTGCDKVLIHDAARPFVSPELISQVIEELDRTNAVIPGLPVADTMKFAPSGMVERTVDRQSLWAVQTPQGFDLAAIHDAHQKAFTQHVAGLTDDASVAEAFGLRVRVINGLDANRKLTTSEDMMTADRALSAKAFSARPDVRMGQGIDFHEFMKGNAVTLCGVKIPHTHKLRGHSDADAPMHALTDAIFGALGEGDIGTFFPPSDPQWKGANSSIFLSKAVELLTARNGILANADITILAEAPKIVPHIAAMKQVLAPILHLTVDRIAIKATTTEKLGAIGRREGLAAFATVTIRLP
jgi:2-C-methyl-D-erythritol 4-phosphate cytidylyltransferase / 2-C-methyl-D-erythritol 2,4-cyclodiphosphate synthase